MLFRDIVAAFERIEATTKRLEMTDLLAGLLRGVPPEEIDRVVYLTQGTLRPDFEGVELGLAEKLAVRVLAFASGRGEDDVQAVWRAKGDMGLVAAELLADRKQTGLTDEPLTVARVYDNLLEIARAKGGGSQDLKIRKLADLLLDATPAEGKVILRVVTGKMRLGVADMTIIDALAAAFATKEARDAIERAYNVCSDLGAVAKALAARGLNGLSDIHLQVGIPVRAMLCERLPDLAEVIAKVGGTAALEYKYDGLRVQTHIDDGDVTLFSRRLENITDQFPDLKEAIRASFRGRQGILEGEAVPVDPNTDAFLPFQEVSHRRGRKHDLEKAMEDVPLRLVLFDCLLIDGEDLMQRPFVERRERLASCIAPTEGVTLAESLVTGDAAAAESFFERAVEAGCEGIVAKNPSSAYEAGARGWNWVKYKRDYRTEMGDTVDLVVVGALAGRGRRAGTYGALLMAAYNEDADVWQTVSKLGTGFDDATLFALPEKLKPHLTGSRHPRVDSRMEADAWFEPAVVMEVLGAEITVSPTHTAATGLVKPGSGLAIRFPRFTGRWREDKGPREATSVKELVEIYRRQVKTDTGEKQGNPKHDSGRPRTSSDN